MKLTIGENIRSFRKKNDLTQEELAERLGVTYQSVSRWENGTTYPDMEMLPAISELLSVTVDELIGMPKIEKEKQAKNLFEEFRRECMKDDYDAGRIVEMLRDIRRNYLDSEHAWNLWSENDRAYRDPKVLPEMRLVVSDYLKKYPKEVFAVRTMSTIEDEEHLEEFLKKYATELDCSKRELLFWRYYLRNEEEGYNRERKYKLLTVFETFFQPDLLFDMNAGENEKYFAYGFLSSVLELVRRDAEDDRPDIWTIERLKIGIENAAGLLSSGKTEEALGKISEVVILLEETMKLVEKAALPTSCRFVDGVEWCAYESWNNRNNDPNEPCERGMCIGYSVDSFFWCRVVVPSTYYNALNEKRFDALRGNEEFETLCERVKALIVTKENGN